MSAIRLAVRQIATAAPLLPPSDAALSLYTYRICPFCCKVKAAVRYKRLAIANVEVNPLTKAQIAFSREHRKVPIAVTRDGRIIVESERIIDEVLSDETDAEFMSDEARKWSRWASDELALMMYPNITRSFAECRKTLAYADEAFGPFEALSVRWIGALGMSLAHSKIKKKYGIENERAALGDRLAVWEDALQTGPFRSGRGQPDLGDIAVYGVLGASHFASCCSEKDLNPGAVEGTQAHDDIMAQSPKIAKWANAVHDTLPAIRIVNTAMR